MSTLTTQDLQQQYIAYFGRPGDPQGIDYWLNNSDIKTAKEFALKISAQEEYANGIGSQPVADQVNALYVNLFGRNADADGLIYWTNQVQAGVLSLGNLAYDLIVAANNPIEGNESQGSLDALALSKKTTAAQLFTDNVKLGGFILDYDNEDAFAVARNFVATVKADTQFTTEQLTTFTQSQVVAMSTAESTAQATAAAAALQLTPLQEAQLAAAEAQKEAADAELAVASQAAVDAAEAKAAAAAATAAAEAEAEAAKNADSASKFTKTTDNLTGAGGADTFSGVIQAGTADGTTIFPGDSVDGGDGIDTVTVSVAGANPGGTYTLSAITTDNVEKFLVSNFETTAPASPNVFEAGLMTGLTTVGLNSSSANGDTTFSLMKNFVDAEMRNGAGSLTLAYDGQQVISGEEDVQNLTVSAVTAGTFTANGIETINVTSEINKSTLSGIASNQLKTLTVSGDQNLKMTANGLQFVKVANGTIIDGTVDASAATGDINLNVGGSASTLKVTGGTGDDTFDFLTTLTKDDVVDGGDGTDTLEMNAATLSTQLDQVTNFEKFAFNPVTTSSTIKGDKVPASITTFIVDASDTTATAGAGGSLVTSTINKIPEGSTVVVKKTVVDKQSGSATDADSVNGVVIALSEANDTTTNEIDVTLDAINVYTGATEGGGINDLQVSNYETINLQSKKNKAGTITANEVRTVTAGSAKTITVTGDADLTLNGLTGGKLTSFDASGLTGKLVLTTTGNNALARATYTAPSSQTTFNFGAGALNYLDTIKGGASSLDEVTGSVGGLTATTGDLDISDVETITLDTTSANTLDLTKVTGAKVLEVSTGIQTITGVDLTSDLRIRADDASAPGDATLKITAADSTGDADTLKIARRLSTNNNGANTIEASGIETLDIHVEDTLSATNTAVFNLAKFTGNSVIAAEGSKDTQDVNINLGTLNKSVTSIDTSGIKGTQTASAASATSAVTFTGGGGAAVNFTGSEWADTFTVSKTTAIHTIAGGVGTDTATLTTGAGFANPSGIAAENVNLVQTAGDDVVLSANLHADTTKFTLTGGNSLSTFTHSAAPVPTTVTNYDASGFDGNIVVTVAPDALDDTVTFTGTGSTTDSLTGSITNNGAGITAKPKIIDVYTVNLSTDLTGTATTTVDLANSSGFKKISTNIGAADTFVLDNLLSGASLKITDAGAAAVFNPKLADDSGADDKLTIEVKGTISGSSGDGAINNNTTIQTSDVETLTIKSSTTVTGVQRESISLANVSMDAASATTTVKITGSKPLTLSATHADIATIDASGMSEGGSVVQGGRSRTTAVTYTGSDGADTFIMAHKDDVIDGGANPSGTTDTLDMSGTELLIGGAEVDLTKSADVLVTFNGVGSTSAQSNFESVDLSNVANTSTFGSIVTAHKSGSTISGLDGGRDVITGGVGDDSLSGNAGNDSITGGAGADRLIGGLGIDSLVLGAGIDTVVYSGITATGNANNISEFVAGASGDIIEIAASGYSYPSAGTPVVVAVSGATSGGGAASNRQIIVDTASTITGANLSNHFAGGALAVASDTGAIYYDADGNFGASPVIIGTITTLTGSLSADNFTIV